MPHIHRTGFTRLADGGDGGGGPDQYNIIFVHGLRGHPQMTWGDDVNGDRESTSSHKTPFRSLFRSKRKETDDGQPRNHPYWPHELLPTDVPDARIWTYGYDADVIEGVFRSNNQNSVSQHGRDLMVKLRREVEEGPIIFVAHSLGGIIVKDAIYRAEPLQQRTQAVVFLGTPHRGSSSADWAQMASNLMAVGLQDSNKTITGSLKVDSEVLENIHERFIKIVTTQDIRVHSFQEARGMLGVKGVSGKIVGDFSSRLGLPDELVETLNADHQQIVKCTGKDDDRYRAISGVLKQLLRPSGPESVSPLVSSSRDQGQPDTTQTTTVPISAAAIPLTEGQPSNASHFIVPFRENKRFVGRDTVLAGLRDALFDDSGPQAMAVVGLGGIGKTQVALQMAYHAKNKRGWSVFWLPALSMAGFEQACTQTAGKLSIPTYGQDAKELVRSYLDSRQSGPWLLIVDNADDAHTVFGATGTGGIYDYLPQNPKGRILFTTRSRDVAQAVADNGDRVGLEEMSEQEARDFLHKLLPKAPLADDRSVVELLRTLTFLPLAISQAAAYIERNQTPISKYVSLLRDSDKEAISLLSREFPDHTRYSESRHAVAKTWLVSFKQIQGTDWAAAQLLSFMSQIEPRAIPEAMLPRAGTEEELENAVGTLSAYAFLQRREDGNTLDMHSLVHLAARVWVHQGIDRANMRQAAVAHLATVFKSDDWDDRERWRQYLPHVLKMLRDSGGTREWEEECRLRFWAGRCLRVEGRIPEAVDLLEHVVKVREITLAENHPDRLASQYWLAAAYQANGQVKVAIDMLEHMVKVWETTRAENHPERLASQHALAGAYRQNGQVKDAINLLKHIVKVQKTTLAQNHPHRLASQHMLAGAYRDNGQVKHAINLLEHVVKVKETTLAENHPSRLAAQYELAVAYKSNSQVKDAIDLLKHVVKMQEMTLVENHPSRLISQCVLAVAYQANSQVKDAIDLLKHVVKVQETTLAENHYSRIISQCALAGAYHVNGQFKDAIILLEHVVKVRETTLAEHHPDRLAVQQALAGAYRANGQVKDAIDLLEHVVKVKETTLAASHPSRLESQQLLAGAYQANGQVKDTVDLLGSFWQFCIYTLVSLLLALLPFCVLISLVYAMRVVWTGLPGTGLGAPSRSSLCLLGLPLKSCRECA